MPEQAGPADCEAEIVVEQVLGLAEGDTEVSAGVTRQQTRSRADVGTGEFQVTTALAGMLTTTAAINVPAVAMPLDLGFGNIGDDMVLESPCRFEIVAATMAAFLGTNLVFDENGAGWRLGPERTWMLAMLLTPAVVVALFAVGPSARLFAALADVL